MKGPTGGHIVQSWPAGPSETNFVVRSGYSRVFKNLQGHRLHSCSGWPTALLKLLLYEFPPHSSSQNFCCCNFPLVCTLDYSRWRKKKINLKHSWAALKYKCYISTELLVWHIFVKQVWSSITDENHLTNMLFKRIWISSTLLGAIHPKPQNMLLQS